MATCKKCGKTGLEWQKIHNKWQLWDMEAIQNHNELCTNPNAPLIANGAKDYVCRHKVLKSRCMHGCV